MRDKLDGIEARFEEIQHELTQVGEDYQRAAELGRERAELEPFVELYQSFKSVTDQVDEARILLDSDDSEMRALAVEELEGLEPQMQELEAKLKAMLLPSDPRDRRNVIVEIRAGTGGNEATLFAADLFRMYSRYAENMKWTIEILSQNETGVGGFKEIAFLVKGKAAYSRLKYESGVHRVQRVPVTESQGRIHTSTATVAVLAEADEVEILIPESDIKMDVYRSGGAGGQSVQKNSTAVRLTHLPTGMVVQCQDERSQLQNRMRAMSILRARLYDIAIHEAHAEEDANRKAQVGSGGRSEKIRTYNFPQNRVTDHRINLTLYKLDEILQGEINSIIDPLSTHFKAESIMQ